MMNVMFALFARRPFSSVIEGVNEISTFSHILREPNFYPH